MIRETWIQSQVKSYQRLYEWYLIPPCLTLSNISCVSRVKWSNPGKGVAPSPTPWCSSYWKGRLLVALNYSRQLYFLLRLSAATGAKNNNSFVICYHNPGVNSKMFTILIYIVEFGIILLIIFTSPSAQAGYDTRSFFKRSLTGLNSEFSFS